MRGRLTVAGRQPEPAFLLTVNSQLEESHVNEDAKKWIWWAIPIAVVIAIGAALYYGYKQRQPELRPQAEATSEAVAPEPAIKHPIDENAAEAEQPLPAIEESDEPVQQTLAEAFGKQIEEFLVPKNIIRHTVVTIDNLPRKEAAVQMWPLKPMGGQLIVDSGERVTLDVKNYARYAPLIGLLQRADTQQIASVYRRYYPLFQQSYVDLGYPDAYFNDRLVEVIDHLLETPEVQGPIELTQPGMFYEYADPSLESRSAGQKLLIRMGPENAAIVKDKLRELRAEVTKQSASTAPPQQ
jgi:hypothetical protein